MRLLNEGRATGNRRARYGLHALIALTFAAIPAVFGTAAYAQAPLVKPDVQVVVAPLGDGTWGISEVYPAAEKHTLVMERMHDLFATSGWPATGSSDVKDGTLGVVHRKDGSPIDRKGSDADAPADPVMSSITRATTGNVMDMANGTIDIAPFLLSLRDLNRVNVVVLLPPDLKFAFHGLRHYEDSHLAVDLVERQGTYLYTANIKDHALTAASLAAMPRFQEAVAPKSEIVPAERHRSSRYTTGLIVGLAAGAGLLVFLWAMRLGGGMRRDDKG